MKNKFLFSAFCLFVGIFFYSCKGPQGDIGPNGIQGLSGVAGPLGPMGTAGTNGPMGTNGPSGPAGPAGTTGAAGATGAQGPMGNANVVYSEWITPTWLSAGENVDNFFFRQKSTAMPLLTKEAIDKGIVYVYFKGNGLVYNEEKAEYELQTRIQPTNFNSWFKIPGRSTGNYYDFGTSLGYSLIEIGENYLVVAANLDKNGLNSNFQRIKIPELVGKNFTFVNDIVKTLHQYRVVVVYGSTKGRLSAEVDMKDYAAVKKHFHLKD